MSVRSQVFRFKKNSIVLRLNKVRENQGRCRFGREVGVSRPNSAVRLTFSDALPLPRYTTYRFFFVLDDWISQTHLSIITPRVWMPHIESNRLTG